MQQAKRIPRMTNEYTKLKMEQLRAEALASVEGYDPLRKQKVSEILNANSVRELERMLEPA